MDDAALAGALAAGAWVFAGAAARRLRHDEVLLRAGAKKADKPGRGAPSLDRLLGSWPGRLLLASAGAAAGGMVAGPPGALTGLGAGFAFPVVRRRRAAARRLERLEEQLAEAVTAVAEGLRAGLSHTQALRGAAEGGTQPLAGDLSAVVDRAALGTPLDASLAEVADSEPHPDVRLVAGVLALHRQTGGDLPMVLDRLARTLRERRSAAREVRSMTAQARLSGVILGLLPLGFFLFLSATSRQDIEAAYRSPLGATAIGIGMAMQGLAFLWIRRLLRVEA
jgi:tight adherence protein B